MLHDLGLLAQGLKEWDLLSPCPHGGALDGLVGVLACHAAVGEFKQDRLTSIETEGEVHVPFHVFGVDRQIAHETRQEDQHIIEQGAGVGEDDALRARVTDVALMPESDVLHRGLGVAAQDAGQAAQTLPGDGVALMGHGGAALLPLGKSFLHLEDFRALEMTELGRPAVDGATDQGDRRQELRMAVALDDLGGDVGRLEPEFFTDIRLHLGIEMGVGADGPAEHSVGDAVAGLLQALDGPAELIVHDSELQPEGDRLGMDAVAAADHRGELVLFGADGDRLAEFVQILEQDVGRLDHLDREGRIEQIGGGESAMDPAGRFPDMRGDLLEKGDHVVVRALLDLPDILDIELAVLADRLGILLGNDPEFCHALAGKGLDLKPDFQFTLLRPNGAHLGAAVAFNHRGTLTQETRQGSLFSLAGVSWRKFYLSQTRVFGTPSGMPRDRGRSICCTASLRQLEAFAAVAGLGNNVSLTEEILDRGQRFPVIAGIAGNRGDQITEGDRGFWVGVIFHGVVCFC